MRQIVIIGDILCTKHIQGISRYAYEIVETLDIFVKELDVIIIYPEGKEILTNKLVNIKLLPIETPSNKHFRKDIVRKYVKKHGCAVIDFGPGYAYYENSVITFHDVRPLEKLGYDSTKSKLKLKLMLWMAKHNHNVKLVTVSEYQKERIHILSKISLSRIEVIGNGWEHIQRIETDEQIFTRFPEIKRNEYFYALGSVAPHKNYKWIFEMAKRNWNFQFVVAGNIDMEYWGIDDSDMRAKNILFTGYVSDEENVALMKNCKVFIHPSKYEGFGIPPLEALALGKNVLISNAACLPEIYGDSVKYFDPDDYCVNIETYEWNNSAAGKRVLEEHSWNNSAKKWLEIIRKMAYCDEK